MKVFRRVLKVVGVVVATAALGVGCFVYLQCSRFDASMDRVYDVAVPGVTRSAEPAVIARGEHLVRSVGACASDLCHGHDLGGGKPVEMGPVATFVGPNITMGNLGAAYSDGELARLIQHGLKKDGRSVRFMPAQDIAWLPDDDVRAIVSYIRTMPDIDRPSGATVIKTLGKVLDRQDQMVLDVARRIDHGSVVHAPPPQPTAEYGRFVARLCTGCHGEHFSGGPLPGAPSSIPVPLNLTPDATGLKDWTFADFDRLMRTGARKNGKQLDPFMPVESWKNLDDTEMHAMWDYLQKLAPLAFGGR